MKYIQIIAFLFFTILFGNSKAQTYSQPAEVISSGGGESTGGNYSNFGVIGETFVDYSVIGGNYNTSIGFLYASDAVTGIDEENFNNQIIRIFPNPTPGKFTLSMELTKSDDFEIKLLNVIGQVIYEENLGRVFGKYQKTIELNGYAKGVYTLELITKEGILNNKLIIH
ncbi:MAG: T9SS type A sorting domain-containing protein [Bacteroidetes bacterium]|nr:T9SS type A sorting domain-containing protein [Bacteroidota bacterium]